MDYKPATQTTYQVGTLKYTLKSLLFVSFWLLWGTFWYDMTQYILVPTLMPLTFKSLGASATWIGVVLGSIPSATNFFLNPFISTASDRTRTRWGRRIPFMAASIPFVTIFCLLLGWMPQIGPKLLGWFGKANGNFSLLLLFSAVFVCFYVSGLFIGIVSCYLAPDVIPFQFIGRFKVASGLMGNAAGFCFNYLLMRYVEDYSRWIYTGVAIAFAVSYTGLCLFIKEGEYPPPEKPQASQPLLNRAKEWLSLYFKECFCNKFYLCLYLGFALTVVSTACRGIFNILFATKDLGLTTEQYGTIMGYGNLTSLGVLIFMLFFIDRCNALLLYMGTGLLIILLNLWGYFAVNSYNTFLGIGLVLVFIYTFQSVASAPMLIMLFPKEKFGQFSSAAMLITCLCSVLANWGCGLCVDHFGNRFIYVWDFAFTILATIFLFLTWQMYRRQRRELESKIQE